jgi:hypothetical protein
MRKLGFFAVAALILAGFGSSWIASTSQARITASTNGVSINPMQVMAARSDLPIQHVVDYSLVYE